MVRKNIFQIRFTDEEMEALKQYAAFKQISIAEVIRDCVKKLKTPTS